MHRDRSQTAKVGRLLAGAKKRARLAGLPFKITLADIPQPKFCPITGRELKYGGWNDWDAASLDRKVPALGYVAGNVRILSRRANMIRFDCLDPMIFLALYSDTRDILEGLRG